jgi:hypothetical protein
MRALLPYLDDHWRETVEARGIASLESISYALAVYGRG